MPFACLTFEYAHDFNMECLREHVNRLHGCKLVAVLFEAHDIARPSGGVAAYVGNAFGSQLGNVLHDACGKTRARRIDDQRIKANFSL